MSLDMEHIKLVLSPKRPTFESKKFELPRTLDPIDNKTMIELRAQICRVWLCDEITDQECVDAIGYVMYLYEVVGKNQTAQSTSTLQAAHNDPIQP